jgi:parallel beta-helix repeat protein
MMDDRSKALVPQDPTSLSPLSRLAERTLAERVEREERGLVAARTLVVGPGGYATISAAVAAAREGDTILVRPGRYEESVVVAGKTITIRGDGERDAIVVGWDQGPAFHLINTRSTLTGLTIVGGRRNSEVGVSAAAIRVTGGAPDLAWLRVTQGYGVAFCGGAAGAIEHSQVHDNFYGIRVSDSASSRIEENDLWGNGDWIAIVGAGTDALVRANRLHDGKETGIWVYDGASAKIEENEVWGAFIGIQITGEGTDALVRGNRVHDGQGRGLWIHGGASPRIQENEIWANAREGICVEGHDTSPTIIANKVRDGLADGIHVFDGASPTIEGNTITGNAFDAIRVDPDANPQIGRNVVSD